MIRKYRESDSFAVMQLWMDTNAQAHRFIHPCYWGGYYEPVKKTLSQAETYIYANESTLQIEGFIELTEDCIDRFSVKDAAQSKGIGKQLLDHAKNGRSNLTLRVYQKNTRAIRFFQREGFVIQSECTDSGTNEKEVIMVWSR